MLELRNPQAQHILRAAVVEDKVRAHLLAMKQGVDHTEHASLYEDICFKLIPELLLLNEQHFGASRGIARNLADIQFAATQQSLELCRKRFLAFAEAPGENFGTWAV